MSAHRSRRWPIRRNRRTVPELITDLIHRDRDQWAALAADAERLVTEAVAR